MSILNIGVYCTPIYSEDNSASICESSIGKIDDETELPDILISINPSNSPMAQHS